MKSPTQSFLIKDAACKLVSDILQRERESGGEGFLDVMVFSYNLSKFHIRMFAVESEL